MRQIYTNADNELSLFIIFRAFELVEKQGYMEFMLNSSHED